MMIKNIVFDIGNVLTEYAWNAHIHKFGFPEEICERVANATVKSPKWGEYDRGVLSDEEIVDSFVENDPGIEREIRLMNEDLSTLVTKVDYAIPWIQELKAKGFRVFYLSNFSRKAEEECAEALDFIPYTDGGILSYKVKLTKPDPAIYQCLTDRYGLKPEECVFLDDLAENVEAAKHCGWQGIVFTGREEANKALEALTV